MITRSAIIKNFIPFRNPEAIDTMLIGNDLDALLSAVYLYDKFGWKIAGLYDLKNIYASQTIDIRQKIREKKIVAVDLDICHASIPSIGHHILQIYADEQIAGLKNSLNPNLIRSRTIQNYRFKYPLGTIHLLRWLFDDPQRSDDFEMLSWLADSTYINAQKYRENLEEWLENFLDCRHFMAYFRETDTIAFEQKMMEQIFPQLITIKLDNRTAMTASRYLGLKGYQTRIRNPQQDYPEIEKLLHYIAAVSQMKIPEWPVEFEIISGNRVNANAEKTLQKYKSLNEFLHKKGIFSYALTYKGTINYTKFERK